MSERQRANHQQSAGLFGAAEGGPRERARTRFECGECGAGAAQWLGRCPTCGSWDTITEAVEPASPLAAGDRFVAPAPVVTLDAVCASVQPPAPTGVGELDRVLGGGVVAGSVTLLAGEPGIGKSTLVLQALAGLARGGRRCVLVSGEESPGQVAVRAARLGALGPAISVVAEMSLPAVRAALDELDPHVVAFDSVQTLCDPALPGLPGSVSQVRGCSASLVALAKAHNVAVVLVGHVTKDGDVAGPRALEHVVDTVLSFEGDRHHALRLLRVLKHRFGPASETGVLEMGASGLADVPDPSAVFLADRATSVPGSVVVPILDGARPLLVEVQALVTEHAAPIPRRAAQGLDEKRLAMLVAVLRERAGVRLAGCDVYVSVIGGLRVRDPGVDLAVALALASARAGRAVDPGTAVLGEVGLAGEVRHVPQAPRRLAEAARLGFARVIVPGRTPPGPGLDLVPVVRLEQALAATGLA